jgi:hypothetical protein
MEARRSKPASTSLRDVRQYPKELFWHGGIVMLAKCANPSCSTPLVYLREGKIFMVESPSQLGKVGSLRGGPKTQNQVEHFWLCGPCSLSMTLTYDSKQGVQVVSKEPVSLRAVAS